MRRFAFDIKSKKTSSVEENGWTCKMKCSNSIGLFYIKSPIIKEITYNKGATVQFSRHTVLGIGYINDDFIFKGLALFDFSLRLLILLCLFIGVSYASENIYSGAFWASIFYLLITFLSWEDDNLYLNKAQRICQMQSE